MKRLICLVTLAGLMALGACSQVTITDNKSNVTVVTKGWPLFQNVDRVIEETEKTVNRLCKLNNNVQRVVPSPLYSEGQQAADETLALIKTAKSILEELFPRHTYTKIVRCESGPANNGATNSDN